LIAQAAELQENSLNQPLPVPEVQKASRRTSMLPALNAIVTIGAIQVVTMAFGLLRSKVIAVTAGPAGVGAIGVIDQVVLLVGQVSTFSLPYASVKFLSAAHSEGQEAFARGYLAFLRVLLLISAIGTAIGVAIVLAKPSLLGGELAAYKSVVIVGLFAIPATTLTTLLTNALASGRRVKASAIFGLLTAIALGVTSIIGIMTAGLYGYYFGNLIASLTLVTAGMVYLVRKERIKKHWTPVSIRSEIARYPQVLSFAGALYLVSFTSPLAELIARYSVIRSGGLIATGLLQAAMGLGLTLRTVVRSSFALFLAPAMNRKVDVAEKIQGAAEFQRAISIITGALALIMVLFPDLWLMLLYSNRFTAAAPYVYLFVLAIAIQLFAAINLALLIGMDYIGTYVVVSLLGDVTIATLSWICVPKFGVAGVAIASLASGTLMFTATAIRLHMIKKAPSPLVRNWLFWYVLFAIGGVGVLSSFTETKRPSVIALKILIWVAFTIPLIRRMQHESGPLLQYLRGLIRLKPSSGPG
jgi:antigen flippase